MIVRPKPNLLGILFSLKGSIAKRIALRSLLVTLLASVIVLVETLHPAYFSKVNATPFTLLGLSLSIFMSFRNNACYDRWWEGRKQLGQMIIDVRSLIRETQVLRDPVERAGLLRSLCGFAHGLVARLRHEDEAQAIKPWSQVQASHPNLPDNVLQQVGARFSVLAEQGVISEWRYTQLEARLVSLSQVQASCERIKSTPLPFPYTLLLHRTIYLFCILLPFAMAEPLGWLTPVFTAIVSYTFFGLDEIGDDLEDPFGFDENDLPCNALLRTLEREVLAALGETDLPPPLEPVEYVLT
ncbi:MULTISPECIES: bestrophin family protein [Pseudomonas]|uniref:Bestrophin n=1 Tax=Pseudomonas fluorescens LMG 5329 TaxID=1324332 RepID=A0A0A1YRL8_PSEFL|nr:MULTISPECIES: bestrophin family protein [Pseudomonas]KGE63960.1 bestrophin [Pseudomonas fluorescens LMG 5329]NWC74922.1 bestrophin [Pseudomonas sp. P7759]NWE03974.1 bestrophin [Pseudomonas sp. IPO3749]NWF19663.1 bestrophin [Pseudomonas sp. IPO3749]